MQTRFILTTTLFASCAVAQAQTDVQVPQPTNEPMPSASPTPSATPEREIVVEVTATRNPRPLSQTTSAITVITRRQIEQKKAVDLTDIIRLAPGVVVSQSGGRGQLASVFLRGAAPRQTLILLDGERVNSPSFGGFDLNSIPADNIERIEVLRGPQSGLYGSDALGGVINIITRRGVGPLRGGGALEIGSQSSNRQIATLRGEIGGGTLSFSASRFKTNNFRSNEDARNEGTSLRFDRPISPRASLAFIGRFDSNEIGVPGSRFFPDVNERNRARNAFGSVQLTNRGKKHSDKVSFGILRRTLRDTNPLDPGNPNSFASNSQNRDKVYTLDAQSALTVGRHIVTGGLEVRREAADYSSAPASTYNKGTSTRAAFLQDEFRAGRFAFVPSVRYEDNSRFGARTNGRFAVGYDLNPQSRFKASIGNGFRIPTLDQLFFPGFSNPNLKAEKSTGYDLGYERTLPNNGRLEVSVFRNRFRDLIDFPPPNFVPLNVSRARTQGLEIGLDQPFGRGFRAIVNHAFLDSSAASNQYLVRRPKFTTSADLLYRRAKLEYDLGVVAQGRRRDVGAMGVSSFGGYTRFDLSVGYDIRPGVQLYTRVQNLLNRRYEEVAGYPSPRFNVVLGLQSSVF